MLYDTNNYIKGPTIQTKKKKAPRKRATQEEDSAASSENGDADQDWEGTPKPKKTPTTGKVKKIKMKKEKSTVPKIKKSGKKSKQRFGRGMSCPPLRSCSLCGFKSTSLPENVNHWQKEHPKVTTICIIKIQ